MQENTGEESEVIFFAAGLLRALTKLMTLVISMRGVRCVGAPGGPQTSLGNPCLHTALATAAVPHDCRPHSPPPATALTVAMGQICPTSCQVLFSFVT